ncbi:hypothetical protein [Luteimicrobium sp. DT211]|uniref:PH-like domain-containing protein n=1 Tax=Luteimicrobium sp. DT211 TaxID=3393412 RepID=UPI003CF79FFB
MNLPLPVAVGIWVVLAAALLSIMWFGWRGRSRRGRALVPALPARPDDAALGEARTQPVDAVYVSSTTAGDWLDRVASHDLGFRSNATVQVFAGGVVVERQGAEDVFVPAEAVVEAKTAPGMAGKFVGKDGLVVVTWRLAAPGADGTVALDTGLRTRHADDRPLLVDAVNALRPAGHAPGDAAPTAARDDAAQETTEEKK